MYTPRLYIFLMSNYNIFLVFLFYFEITIFGGLFGNKNVYEVRNHIYAIR